MNWLDFAKLWRLKQDHVVDTGLTRVIFGHTVYRIVLRDIPELCKRCVTVSSLIGSLWPVVEVQLLYYLISYCWWLVFADVVILELDLIDLSVLRDVAIWAQQAFQVYRPICAVDIVRRLDFSALCRDADLSRLLVLLKPK